MDTKGTCRQADTAHVQPNIHQVYDRTRLHMHKTTCLMSASCNQHMHTLPLYMQLRFLGASSLSVLLVNSHGDFASEQKAGH